MDARRFDEFSAKKCQKLVISPLLFTIVFTKDKIMKVVYIKEFGGAENLEIREVEDLSKPKNTEVLVNIKASAINRFPSGNGR